MILHQQFWRDCHTTIKERIIKSLWISRKPSTIEKYCSTLRKFLVFCQEKDIPVFIPFDSLVIAQYLEETKISCRGKSAVSNALLSIKWLHSFMPGLNHANDPANDQFLSRIVESTNRNVVKMKQRKKPLSLDMIKGILSHLSSNPSLTELRDCLIPVLSYSLLLRHDEISHINCNHINSVASGLKILIPSSKTDTYREGKYVYLSKNNNSVYNLFFNYLSKSNLNLGINHFLFGPISFSRVTKQNEIENRKLSYDSFNKIFKNAVTMLGLNPEEFGTHSARSGGATSLAPFVSQYDLMMNGRWSDPRSIGSYVETPSSIRFQTNEILDINL